MFEVGQDIVFCLLVIFLRIFLNGYNVFYYKGILKMEQKLGGVVILEFKFFIFQLIGWSK